MKINEFTPDTAVFDKVGGNTYKQNVSNDSKDNIVNNEDGIASFSNLLQSKLNGVNNDQVQANNSIQEFVEGDRNDIHNVMLDAEQAKMSLELAVQIRNKFVEAYQEINRTQL
ncbi:MULTISPECIES: flagellar hook-basal body complex protein FliE [Clostridium]|uniref:Flagellar hook-basal body complex protein FliE n=1 Tax=Clostridium ragsdalei P11 TaxID=1353534 RepID=A0A1A6AY71_9CLOT|nr:MULTISPECIES: flagellar hook-basal body complex protein FliE [Clostridium]OBR94978.1 flagellar hook-basal body complex protein FliE [Clostridium ragsdalei P11]QXE20271.1 flagellar hook-basal body complex protein FliE [Clostridium sp. 001]